MICPLSFPYFFLALVATNWPRCVQTYQSAFETLQDLTREELEQNSREVAVQDGLDLPEAEDEGDGPSILQLRSSIKAAFRFLEEHPVDRTQEQILLEETLRPLQSKHKAKRLPLNQHNFIRFGKRFTPSTEAVQTGGTLKKGVQENEGKRRFHNFVRIGKRDVRSSFPQLMMNTGQSNYNQASADWFPTALRQLAFHRRRGNPEPTTWAQNPLFIDKTNRQSSFIGIDASNQGHNDVLGSSSEHSKRSPTTFAQFRRSLYNLEAHDQGSVRAGEIVPNRRKRSVDKSSSSLVLGEFGESRGNDSGEEPSREQLNFSKRFQTARIGRIPASVFYRPWSEVGETAAQSSSLFPELISRSAVIGRQNIQSLPRYG